MYHDHSEWGSNSSPEMTENMSENMETPPPEPPVRRTTRSALVEIPARLGALSVTDNVGRMNGRQNMGMTGLLVETNLPTSYISPSPSPDELVIQARGRRRLPVSWSPDIDTGRCMSRSEANKERTPVKASPNSKMTGAGGGVVLRSTPRKRLLLNDPMELSPSPEKKRNMSPTAKKVRVDKPMSLFGGTLDIALKALSNDQLVSVIQTMVIKHPYLEEELKASLPAPDLRPLEERLHDLKRNIFKSLPNSRLTSKTDSPAYNRASTHVLAFKKCVVEQGRMLVSSQQWESVIDYVLEAWRQVAATPLWDNPPHNAARRHCFKFLAAQCMTALRRLHWPPERCNQLYTKLETFVKDNEDIKSCLKQLEIMRESGVKK